NDDRRIVFAIPYEGRFTLIGTTDLAYDGDPGAVAIDEIEIDYLLQAVNRYFRAPVERGDVVWSYSGVRPLYDDASDNVSAVTRDYVFDVDAADGQPPLLSIFGGKITTYRRLAEHALEKLAPFLGCDRAGWTADAPLPGGDIPGADFDGFLADLKRDRPWLPAALAERYARAYGSRTRQLLGEARSLADLGRQLWGDLYEAELEYLAAQEWAATSEDVLWRRSKLGLHVPDGTAAAIDDWFRQRADGTARSTAKAYALG
ncbi:MAG TPA: FAD-dependent oxidoreductase, partial [Alphaproteobacteria bacterium]|nr:FAD-dependent oxidoreductase [Alphaproteobacteria bacterium]